MGAMEGVVEVVMTEGEFRGVYGVYGVIVKGFVGCIGGRVVLRAV